MTPPTRPATVTRRVLHDEDLRRIHTAIRNATDTRELIIAAVGALYWALSAGTTTATDEIHPDRYAIPTSQWQTLLAAITGRAQAWGTAAEVGLELATRLMPGHYDDPTVPAPDLPLPDDRPTIFRFTLTRDAIDVIAACETYLDRLRTGYGPTSEIYQKALHSWHRALTAVLTMNTGAHTQVSRDGDLSLLAHTGSGMHFAVIFHPAIRRCTADGCPAVIADDGTTRPDRAGDPTPDHRHTPSYPVDAPHPGVWTLHS